MGDQIESVRDFNRYYTRRVGALDDHYLGQGRPLSEARLLFEIGTGADVRDLRGRLGLDSGFLSRLLRSLEDQGLVTVRPHPGDGRVRVVELTTAGRRERDDLDARSRDSVGELLDRLTPDQRDRLIEAQQQVRRLLRLASVQIATVADDSEVARGCLHAYRSELTVRMPDGYEESSLVRPGETGAFLVAYEEGVPIGCVAWSPLAEKTAEVRHLWVSAAARGLGLGRRLLSHLESDAARRGITTMQLGTHPVLTEAVALYGGSGYHRIPSYDDSPHHLLSFAKTLGQAPPAASA
ncbi:GNAT family N-acetyltransferase [Micromonosporaceae bacterium Da 78-11]